MNILVTGGAGFIGSNLIEKLLKNKENNVTCIDNFDPFYNKNIKLDNIKDFKNNNNFNIFEIDIRDIDSLKNQLAEQFDVTIYLAAKAGVRPSIENPIEYQSVNVLGTQALLEFAKFKEIKKFIFASSSSVYGANSHFPWKEEDNVLKPISPYAASKISGELLGSVYSTLYDIQFLALRFFTVYGPRQRPDLAINKFTKSILERKEITIYGDGTTSRDYTYIDDIVDGITSCLDYNETKYEIINLGNNISLKLKDLVNEIEKATDIKAKILYMSE